MALHRLAAGAGGLMAAVCGQVLPSAWPQPARAQAQSARAPRTLTWEELVPKGWDPAALFRDRPTALIREGSAAERELIREMREVWDKAPTRDDLKGLLVRLPGYVVPLDLAGDKVQDFLLVPYFGACIHSPPPPANQIVHVTPKKPLPLRTMDMVWVIGRLDTERQDSAMGASGYSIKAEAVDPYRPTDTRR
jgi:hypothetical protein